MGLFNNDKSKEGINELSVQTGNNTNDIVALKRDNQSTRKEFELYKVESEERYKFLLDKIELLEKERRESKAELINNDHETNNSMSCENVCKKLNIKNLNTSTLKFYLHEKGLLNISINPNRNVFSLNAEKLSEVDSDLLKYIHIEGEKFSFTSDFIDYANNNCVAISESIDRYNNKKKQYEKSKKNLESKNVENYKEEIGKLCGIKDSYDESKWKALYAVFGEKYQDFNDRYKKYIDKQFEINPYLKYKPSKLYYIVNEMCEGMYLLKIACDLYA